MIDYRDRSKAITAEDIIRRYNLESLKKDRKAINTLNDGLTKINKNLENYIEAVLNDIDNLQNQVDGNITTWFFVGVPTLENQPAKDWIKDEDKNTHLGDLYYDQETGYAYRWANQDNNYCWIKITDNDVVEALAIANSAKDTADSKRRVFYDEPIPPYDSGDIWIYEGEIYRCIRTREKGEWNTADWVNDLIYTDDTLANKAIENLNNFITEVTTHYVTNKIMEETINSITSTIESVQIEVDKKNQVFTEEPTPPYNVGDVWIQDEKIYVCINSKEEGDFLLADFRLDLDSQQFATKTQIEQTDNRIILLAENQKKDKEDLITQTKALIQEKVGEEGAKINLSVEQKINNIQIGGRNLLAYTAYETLGGVTVRGNYATVSIDKTNTFNGNNSLKIVSTAAAVSGTKDIWQKCWSNQIVGEHIKLSLYIKGSVAAKAFFRLAGSYTDIASPAFQFDVTTSWKKLEIDLGVVNNSGTPGATEIIYGFNVAGTFYINSPMLAYGDKFIDWSPAPEDKLDNSRFNKAEIVAEINNGVSNVKIYANNIKLEGLVTANENFKILTDGSMIAKNGSFTGVITSTNGHIAGWQLSDGLLGSQSTIDGNTFVTFLASKPQSIPDSNSKSVIGIYRTKNNVFQAMPFYIDVYGNLKANICDLFQVNASGFNCTGITTVKGNPVIVTDGESPASNIKSIMYGVKDNSTGAGVYFTREQGGWFLVKLQYSDKRLKRRIKNSKYNALDTIMKIKHRQFIYRDINKKWDIGVIADELQEIDNNLVYENGDQKIKTVDTFYWQGILSKSIQELYEKFQQKEERIKELEYKINTQDKRITDLENKVNKLLKLIEGKKEE